MRTFEIDFGTTIIVKAETSMEAFELGFDSFVNTKEEQTYDIGELWNWYKKATIVKELKDESVPEIKAPNKKIWIEEEIKDLLMKSDKAVCRAVVAIYERQTAEEKETQHTRIHNGIGFNGPDSSFLSYCAEWIKSGKPLNRKFLDKSREKIIKYRKQLLEIANSGV